MKVAAQKKARRLSPWQQRVMSMRQRGRVPRTRFLVVNTGVLAAAAASSGLHTDALSNEADIVGITGGNSVSNDNFNWRLTYAYQVGETVTTAAGRANALVGKDGLPRKLRNPLQLPQGVVLNVDVTNDAGANNSISVIFEVIEWVASGRK